MSKAAGVDRVADRVLGPQQHRVRHVPEEEVEVDDGYPARGALGETDREVDGEGRLAAPSLGGEHGEHLAVGGDGLHLFDEVRPPARRGQRRPLEHRAQFPLRCVRGDDVAHSRPQRPFPHVGARVGHDHHADLGAVPVDERGDVERALGGDPGPDGDDFGVVLGQVDDDPLDVFDTQVAAEAVETTVLGSGAEQAAHPLLETVRLRRKDDSAHR